ncbi:MAG: thioredoxin-disulfide reductase [Candidatus Roizmanbacteria bacterium]|nr:thioredoxin-disulfide reductase [Candidatus Roizmanbacteria bacterium]
MLVINMMFDVIIIGSGPAGLTAGIYTSRAALKTLIISGKTWGGQLMLTTEVENYPGFPEGILGPELMDRMRKQAVRFGTEMRDEQVTGVDFSKEPFTVKTEGHEYRGKSVIIATGADTLWLNVPGEKQFIGKGVSSCAPCDAFFYKNKEVIVVGGGDSAMEEALVLTKFATNVMVVHRRSEFRASKIMQERVMKHPKIEVLWNTTIEEIVGTNTVEKVKLKTDENVYEKRIDGIFVAIGHVPNSKIFEGKLDLDTKGFIKRIPSDKDGLTLYKSATSVPGIFVAGDVHDYHSKQAVTAAAYGCEAALDVARWLEEK